jgi:NitT/TauT family transport system ATP-binding protein
MVYSVNNPMHDIVLECAGVSHRFGPKRVLHDVCFKIVRGEIVGLVRPSGCGKSTLLRGILGTHPPSEGRILVNGRPVATPGRDRGVVYQRYTLYPFLTAVENVAFGLLLDETSLPFRLFRFRKWRRIRRAHLKIAEEMLVKLGLGDSLDSYPTEMSGGMCQRVALAQALVMKPEILLLDEPFGALDEATREDLQRLLLEFYQENLRAKSAGRTPPYTILIVTHELNEAIYVSDRVMGLSQYWLWEETGAAAHPGATTIYDAVAPVFHPDQPLLVDQLAPQRAEVRQAVFDTIYRPPRNKYIKFWQQVADGLGTGIMRRDSSPTLTINS